MAKTSYRASSPRALLNYALKRIQAGWCQGVNTQKHPRHGNAQFCLLGSLVVDTPYRNQNIQAAAQQLIQDQIPGGLSMVAFNDVKSRRKTEVIAVLKGAILAANVARA